MTANRVGLGTWPLGGRAYGPVDEQVAREVVLRALEGETVYFDTADIYGDGRAERLIGEIIGDTAGVRIITKAGYIRESSREQDFSYAYLRSALERSLRRLKRSRVDLFLLHSPPLDSSRDAVFEAANRLVDEGYCTRAGISLAHVGQYPLLDAWRECSAVELIYNLLDQRARHDGVLKDCGRRGRLVLARLPLANGLLSGRYRRGHVFPLEDVRGRWPQVQIDRWLAARDRFEFLINESRSPAQAAIAFCLAAPNVVPIPGGRTADQVRENMGAAAQRRRLTGSEIEAAYALWPEVQGVVPG